MTRGFSKKYADGRAQNNIGRKQVNPNSLANQRPPKKGEIRNPNGSNGGALAPLRKLIIPEIAAIGTLILDQNVAGLQEIITDAGLGKGQQLNPKSSHSALKVWMATVAMRGIAKGDPYALDTLLNRIVGKVPNKLQAIGPDGGELTPATVPGMSSEDRRTEIAHYQKLLEEQQQVGIAQAVAKDAETEKNQEAIEVESHIVEEPSDDADGS